MTGDFILFIVVNSWLYLGLILKTSDFAQATPDKKPIRPPAARNSKHEILNTKQY
jgi:hypothetical protein